MAIVVRALFVLLTTAVFSSAGADSATFTIRQLSVQTGDDICAKAGIAAIAESLEF